MSSDGAPTNICTAVHTPELESLLSKLRPFQRAAFDFAVHGTSIEDGSQTSGSNKRHGGKKLLPSHKKSIDAELERGVPLAGAGTGRILLGDEVSYFHVPDHILSRLLNVTLCLTFYLPVNVLVCM